MSVFWGGVDVLVPCLHTRVQAPAEHLSAAPPPSHPPFFPPPKSTHDREGGGFKCVLGGGLLVPSCPVCTRVCKHRHPNAAPPPSSPPQTPTPPHTPPIGKGGGVSVCWGGEVCVLVPPLHTRGQAPAKHLSAAPPPSSPLPPPMPTPPHTAMITEGGGECVLGGGLMCLCPVCTRVCKHQQSI